MSEVTAPGNGDNGDRCPECDERADWQVSRRHRFSPFGAVLLAVLAFWTALLGWSLDLGYSIPVLLLAAALIIGLATRRAETCSNCGFVRPHHR